MALKKCNLHQALLYQQDWDQRGGFNLFLLVRWQLQEKLRTLYYKALAGVIESYNLV